jgi:hypothetical protein
MPDDQRLDEGLSLVWTSEPFSEPSARELVGPGNARLWLSSTEEIAFLSVKLCDVAPDGTSVLVTKGILNLTHRQSHAKAVPLVPGEIYEINLPLLAVAYRFRPGHHLRLMIAAADFQNAWPTPQPHTLSVHFGPSHPSRLELPLTQKGTAPPAFQPSDFAPLPPDQIPTPDYSVTRDLIKNALTVNIRTLSGAGVNRSAFTVQIDRPAQATVSSEYEYPIERAGLSFRVRSQCVTRSDEQAFHHLTQVEVTVNGRPHWQKSWTISVPRIGW